MDPLRIISTEKLAYTASAGVSAAFGSTVTAVRLVASSDCHIRFGAAPTATTSHMFLPAGAIEYFAVTPGEKVSVVQATAGGSLYITQMTR